MDKKNNNINILCVDDEVSFNNYLCWYLEDHFNVKSANSVDEAIELLKNSAIKIDIVMTDYLMENKSGIDLIRILKELGLSPLTILMTACVPEDKLKESKIDFILKKPF